jgi:hypothetical protein
VCDVGEVFALGRGNKLAADVVIVALLERIGDAQFADVREIHVTSWLCVVLKTSITVAVGQTEHLI